MAFHSNNNEEDPWAQIFDMAEGKSTCRNDHGDDSDDDDDHHDRRSTVDRLSKDDDDDDDFTNRPKYHQTASSRGERYTTRRKSENGIPFQEYLKERSSVQTQLRLEPWIVLQEGFLSTPPSSFADEATACQEWDPSDEEDNSGMVATSDQQNHRCCKTCGLSSFYHRAKVIEEQVNSNDSDDCHAVPLELYCFLRNLRHETILFLANEHDTVPDDAGYRSSFVTPRSLKREGQRLLQTLQRTTLSDVASQLQSNFTKLQTLLQHQHKAFKRHKKQKESKNNTRNKTTPHWRYQAEREAAIRIVMQCDECYYQLYYLEITQQLSSCFYTTPSSKSKYVARLSAGKYVPHPITYFGEGFCILHRTDDFSNSNCNGGNEKVYSNGKHYLDKARELVSAWKRQQSSDLSSCSVVDRFHLDFEQHQHSSSHCSADALTALHYIRFLETITLFPHNFSMKNVDKAFLLAEEDTSWLSSPSSTSSSLLSKDGRTKGPPAPEAARENDDDHAEASLSAPPPAPALLMAWRDSCRDFLTHLYAYATLPPALIHDILKTCREDEGISNIVEVGAGTGYVAHLFQQHEQQRREQDDVISIEAYDLVPTPPPPRSSKSAGTATRMNEYHGATPSFTRVVKASCTEAFMMRPSSGAADEMKKSKTALLLCYPPPDSAMGVDAIKSFCDGAAPDQNTGSSSRRRKKRKRQRLNGSSANSPTRNTGGGGSVVIHIGEFYGLTGTRDLERYLLQHFDCIARHACPTFGTDATSVTIWKARKAPQQQQQHGVKSAHHHTTTTTRQSLLLPCHYCQEKEATKRLRCIRHLEYCSRTCFLADCQAGVVNQHVRCSSLNFGVSKANDIISISPLDFDNHQHFLDIRLNR